MAVSTTKTNPTNNNLSTTLLLPFIIAISLILTYQTINTNKTFTNAGANIASASSISIKAKDVDIKTIKNRSSYNYKYKDAQFKGKSVKHIQSSIKANGNLVVDAKNNVNLKIGVR